MNKNKKLIIIPIIILILAIISILKLNNNKFNLSTDEILKDIDGKDIGILTIDSKNVKSLNIVDKKPIGNNFKVTINIDMEYIEKGGGSINKFQIKNDILHQRTDSVDLNYSKQDKNWQLVGITNFETLKNITDEVETSIKIIPFKSEEELLQDLKDKNIGIPISDTINLSITLGKDEQFGLTPVTKINNFKLDNIESRDDDIWKTCHVSIDVNFDRNIINNMYEDNGHYNAKGQFKVIYKLEQNSSDSFVWNLSSVVNNTQFKTIKR